MTELIARIGQRVIIAALIGFIVGAAFGLVVLGWWLWPVKWIDADPFDLRQEHKEAYITMVADSYALNRDLKAAKARLTGFEENEMARIVFGLMAEREEAGRALEAQRLRELADVLELSPEMVTAPTVTPPPRVVRPPSLPRRLTLILGVFLLSLLGVLIVVQFFLWLGRRRMAAPGVREEGRLRIGEPLALGPYVAIYSLGAIDYSESFHLEDASGDLIGECGVRASELIGQGESDKVTAFEVWLFDKMDVRTVTKVLMSEYAYHDDALRERLATKGDLVLAETGRVIAFETATLQLEAEVIDMAYGARKDLPPNSYFTELTVQLAPMRKEVG